MSDHFALQPAALDAGDERLSALETQLEAREQELSALKHHLLELQTRYFEELGPLYARLYELEEALAAIEIRLGLRPPPELERDDADDASEAGGAAQGCSNQAAPSHNLKKVFRKLAKVIHPDRAADERTRYRRHSLMAEANRAYAERDEDRLRLILSAWERSADLAPDDSGHRRAHRRIADIDARLIAIDAELADLRRSAIARLADRIDEARSQGWDLFAEIVQEVKREITRARSRLAALQRLK